MEYMELEEEKRKKVSYLALNELTEDEKKCLQTAETILQKIAGIYIGARHNLQMADMVDISTEWQAEMAGLYRSAANTLTDLRNCII